MGELWSQIHAAINENRTIIGVHATIRLRQRRIPTWQVVAGSLDGSLITEKLKSRPNPTAEVKILLPDGTSAKAVWSWLAADSTAKLVTVHFFDT